MKRIAAFLAMLASCATEAPVERAGPAPDAVRAATQGRIAGEPTACVSRVGLRNSRAIAGAILFEGPGGIVYVNEGIGGCQALAMGRSIRTSMHSSRLCSGDIVTAFEPVSGVEYGGCMLGDFVPYRRTD